MDPDKTYPVDSSEYQFVFVKAILTSNKEDQQYSNLFRDGLAAILREYSSLARDPQRCKQVCVETGKPYRSPFYITCQNKLAAMGDEEQAQLRKLCDHYRRRD